MSAHPTGAEQFASDNYAGICPEALAGMIAANEGHVPAYGDDPHSVAAVAAFRALFETDCEVFFTFTGTAANALALAATCQPYHAVICTGAAHVDTDECGAPEFFTGGAKLLVAPAAHGKLTPHAIARVAHQRRDVHSAKPRAVSISQSTETGQVYSVAEVAAIGGACRELGLALHMDGARFANAIVQLGCTPAEATWRAGVDVLSFGGTKNGMAAGEAIVFFDRALAADFAYRRKQAGQLASKMRFLAAPWTAMLNSGAWLRHAAHANDCARHFAATLHPVFPVEANAVFLRLPPALAAVLRERGWLFYDFFDDAVRFMFAWNSTTARIDALLADMAGAL